MAKRKREEETTSRIQNTKEDRSKKKPLLSNGNAAAKPEESSRKQSSALNSNGNESVQNSISIQIITGSYDRVLHGIIATIPASESARVHFQDNFLFNAHSSAIKCLALSPAASEEHVETGKVMLASGGTDEKINLYSVATSLPQGPSLPSLSSVPSLENPKNKELGTLFHHTSSVNVLHFPSRSKLISGSDDNTIAISRTKDWTVLTKVKAPMPKVQGRPSGDTAPLGGTPAGINDFAVHPSMKLMISVGKGEKCMRLWNLVTGKKANVLSFERDMLQSVGEGKWSRGEGQKVVWNPAGTEFAIAFEKGVAVFALDSEITCVAVPDPATKVHRIAYVTSHTDTGTQDLLAVSTENGRILFYSTDVSIDSTDQSSKGASAAKLRACLGGNHADISSRIKDFQVIPIPGTKEGLQIVATACSDGAVTVWKIQDSDLPNAKTDVVVNHPGAAEEQPTTNGTNKSKDYEGVPQIGVFLGKYETGNRITCMQALRLHSNLAEDDENGKGEDEDDDDNDGHGKVEEASGGSGDESDSGGEDEFEGFD